MTRVVLAQCVSQKKKRGRHPAKELYTSPYFKAQRRYAEHFGDDWFILSAEYGLLHPNARLAPYDTTMGDVDDTREWAARVIKALAFRTDAPETTLEILGGAKYADPITSVLGDDSAFGEIDEPLRGQRLKPRTNTLHRAVEADKNTTLEGFQ